MRTTRSGRWATSSASLVAVGLVVLATFVVTSAGAAGARPFSTSITTDPLATVPVTSAAAPSADAGSGIIVGYDISGRTILKKLGSAVLLKGRFDAVVDGVTGTINGTITIDPAVGTFLSFGFVPVNATTTFTEQGGATGTFTNGNTDVKSQLELGLSDAKVNGTKLDAGPRCRTVTPVPVRINGPLNLLGSSDFTTTVTIPQFTGCGATENLDPLFDGLVSGPGNELDITLTLRCSVTCTDN